MKLVIDNIAKIEQAEVEFDGLTVICGRNDTGKSTLGKVLFATFNALIIWIRSLPMRDIEKSDPQQKES